MFVRLRVAIISHVGVLGRWKLFNATAGSSPLMFGWRPTRKSFGTRHGKRTQCQKLLPTSTCRVSSILSVLREGKRVPIAFCLGLDWIDLTTNGYAVYFHISDRAAETFGYEVSRLNTHGLNMGTWRNITQWYCHQTANSLYEQNPTTHDTARRSAKCYP